MNERIRRPLLASLLALGLLAAGCKSTHHLHEYDFTDRTVAAVAAVPPPATILTIGDMVVADREHPAQTAIRIGAALARDRAARRALARMDSALTRVDVAERLAREALLRSAPYLRYRPTSDVRRADFLLDIRIEQYGLQARSWDVAVYFVLDGEVQLIDNRGGRVIWSKKIHQIEPVTSALLGFPPVVGDVFTAAALSSLSVEEMVQAFERLTDYAAHHLADALRDDYYARRN